MALLPITEDGFGIDTELEFQDFPTNTYYVDELSNQIRGFTDGHAAMVQAVKVVMAVDRYKYQIISPNFGMEYDGLIGADFGFICSELKRRIQDSFIPDNRVTSVDDFVFTDEGESMTVTFVVYTVYGPVQADTVILT